MFPFMSTSSAIAMGDGEGTGVCVDFGETADPTSPAIKGADQGAI